MFEAKMTLILTFIILQKFFRILKIYPRSEPYLPVGKTNRTCVQGWQVTSEPNRTGVSTSIKAHNSSRLPCCTVLISCLSR